MFSFRRKPRKPDSGGSPFIRTSPSLPELHTQGIPWPENLVDLSSLPQSDAPQVRPQGAAKTIFPTQGVGPIAFHKPWSSPEKPPGRIISEFFTSRLPPPSAFETRKQPVHLRAKLSQRKARSPTTFNVMVVGAQGTGKTSLLRLLLDTADISPTATADQKAAVERFLRGAPRRTDSIQSACVEICESRYDRILLSVIDTPGLDFQESHELRLERQVTAIVKYLDAQFTDTLNEETKVVRQNKGDQHVHLCIYMIDPKSIMSTSLRRARSSLPAKTPSAIVVNHSPDLSSFSDDTTSDETNEEIAGELTMSPADIRVIRRLGNRANVLPVIARADSLTDETLADVKRVVRRDLHNAGLDFGVFGPAADDGKRTEEADTNGNGTESTVAPENAAENDTESEPQVERRSRSVIKLRAPKVSVSRRSSRSRSRMSLSELAAAERAELDTMDAESVANVRFSAGVVAKADLSESLPFALISPEQVRRRRPLKPSISIDNTRQSFHSAALPSEDGHAPSVADAAHMSPTTPPTPSSRSFPYLTGPPADLRGVFVRKFRWGAVDVLNPEHCDFAAMRTAVLSTHMKMLKIRTREVLYEKFRTEKLLAKRATRNIGETETRKLLEDLGL
ncbi:hypothetical protein POSPLADRAFT_1172164 [Postia placenta MAD-698-R-SB12]|uniref:Septin-type G domain-containing protein n=1 Tax=Postia placenta MAD-698-R-SB12 TaxID=670580 RepID=A0A1X6MU40_9APHY|nr:hypothetical protein POSPLADRAFT_1172164 [Postia placenta MAD-698-R-SB12]OSX59911.1 hypothetical protein POSPLADRAFT_1172164 [Postia placenta MAD-698-R-SB12]